MIVALKNTPSRYLEKTLYSPLIRILFLVKLILQGNNNWKIAVWTTRSVLNDFCNSSRQSSDHITITVEILMSILSKVDQRMARKPADAYVGPFQIFMRELF